MKRYLVFGYDRYYPCGGWSDFQQDFNTIKEAKSWISENILKQDYFEIIDSFTKEEIIE